MKILIVDLETTGFQNDNGKIVEIGLVVLDLETGNKTVLLDVTCREAGMTANDRSAWIFKNSSLTVESVRNAQDLSEIAPLVQRLIDLYPDGITAYNRNFDINFLQSRGFTFPKLLPCPMILCTSICKIPQKNGRGGYKFPKAQEAYDYFFPNSGFIEEHRGASDCLMEASIVHQLYKIGIFKID